MPLVTGQWADLRLVRRRTAARTPRRAAAQSSASRVLTGFTGSPIWRDG